MRPTRIAEGVGVDRRGGRDAGSIGPGGAGKSMGRFALECGGSAAPSIAHLARSGVPARRALLTRYLPFRFLSRSARCPTCHPSCSTSPCSPSSPLAPASVPERRDSRALHAVFHACGARRERVGVQASREARGLPSVGMGCCRSAECGTSAVGPCRSKRGATTATGSREHQARGGGLTRTN